MSAERERQLLAISPRSIDYRLAAHKRAQRRRLYGRTKPGTLLKPQVPLKTDRWDVQTPGFTEIDLVSHSGEAASGEFCHSLNLTDIHSTCTETCAVLGKGQHTVQQALQELRQSLPFPWLGIDSDNGSEFIHRHLYRYCGSQHIQFPRGRPYKKDDNAHIEQENWTPARRLLGYLRYDSPAALEAIHDLYRKELRLFQNLFLPSVKLKQKLRVGSRLRRRYQPPQTPLERLGACKNFSQQYAELKRLRDRRDPFQLSQQIQAKLLAIFQLAAPVNGKPIAQLPQLSTAIHRKKKVAKKKEKTMMTSGSVPHLQKTKTPLGLPSQIA